MHRSDKKLFAHPCFYAHDAADIIIYIKLQSSTLTHLSIVKTFKKSYS